MRPNRQQQVIDALTQKSDLTQRELGEVLGLGKNHTSVLLCTMLKKTPCAIVRTGEKRHYRYRLACAE